MQYKTTAYVIMEVHYFQYIYFIINVLWLNRMHFNLKIYFVDKLTINDGNRQ